MAPGARPTADQLLWHEQELGMFFHYDIPVFEPGVYLRPWKDRRSPDIYNPDRLDTDQWMEAAKAMGAKYVVFVAKHCSGFLLWQSDAYGYGLKQSKWRNGKGDVVKDFVASARRYGLKPGLYASFPVKGWYDGANPAAVNPNDAAACERYKQVCVKMYTELWRNYGDLFEIWFDGGVVTPEKGGPDLLSIIHKYQPHAVLSQGPETAGNLIRWIGNERGVAPYPCWSASNAGTAEGGDRETRDARNIGNPDGRLWAPGECDVPLYADKWMWGGAQARASDTSASRCSSRLP